MEGPFVFSGDEDVQGGLDVFQGEGLGRRAGGWVGGWVGGLWVDSLFQRLSNEVVDAMGGWVGGWVGLPGCG